MNNYCVNCSPKNYKLWNEDEKYVVYGCSECKRTIKVPSIRTWQPNLICKCTYPDHINLMHKIDSLSDI